MPALQSFPRASGTARPHGAVPCSSSAWLDGISCKSSYTAHAVLLQSTARVGRVGRSIHRAVPDLAHELAFTICLLIVEQNVPRQIAKPAQRKEAALHARNASPD